MVCQLIIDAHTHIGLDKDGSSQTIGELKASMAEYGIDASVVFPFDVEGDLVSASRELLKYKSHSIFPFLRFDPNAISSGEVKKLLGNDDFMGVKLHPRSQNFDPLDKKFYPIFHEIEDSGKPLIIHTRKEATPNSDPDRIVRLADDFHKMNIIIGHFAFVSQAAIEKIQFHENLFLETSVVSSNVVIRLIARKIGVRKIIFGSDSPMSDQEIELLKIRKSGLNEREKEMILSENLLSLLNSKI